jgi:TrmH family RNA methyltransferase
LQQAHYRRAEHAFWTEGVRNFVQAFDADWPFGTIVHSRILLRSRAGQIVLRRAAKKGVRCISLTPEQFRSISSTERASGIGAILRQRWASLDAIDPGVGPCTLILEKIRSPGNLGTILRTAEAAGVGGIICVGGMADPFHPSVVRASMGGLVHVNLARAQPRQLRDWAAGHDMRVVSLSPEANPLWTSLPTDRPIALVIGEERQGLSETLRGFCNESVRLPMSGRADSLNVAVATSVMVYELLRRKSAIHSSGESTECG